MLTPWLSSVSQSRSHDNPWLVGCRFCRSDLGSPCAGTRSQDWRKDVFGLIYGMFEGFPSPYGLFPMPDRAARTEDLAPPPKAAEGWFAGAAGVPRTRTPWLGVSCSWRLFSRPVVHRSLKFNGNQKNAHRRFPPGGNTGGDRQQKSSGRFRR